MELARRSTGRISADRSHAASFVDIVDPISGPEGSLRLERAAKVPMSDKVFNSIDQVPKTVMEDREIEVPRQVYETVTRTVQRPKTIMEEKVRAMLVKWLQSTAGVNGHRRLGKHEP